MQTCKVLTWSCAHWPTVSGSDPDCPVQPDTCSTMIPGTVCEHVASGNRGGDGHQLRALRWAGDHHEGSAGLWSGAQEGRRWHQAPGQGTLAILLACWVGLYQRLWPCLPCSHWRRANSGALNMWLGMAEHQAKQHRIPVVCS